MKFYQSPFVMPIGIIVYTVISLFTNDPPSVIPTETICVEATAAVVSSGHDLYEPLRCLSGTARLVARQAAEVDSLDEDRRVGTSPDSLLVIDIAGDIFLDSGVASAGLTDY